MKRGAAAEGLAQWKDCWISRRGQTLAAKIRMLLGSIELEVNNGRGWWMARLLLCSY